MCNKNMILAAGIAIFVLIPVAARGDEVREVVYERPVTAEEKARFRAPDISRYPFAPTERSVKELRALWLGSGISPQTIKAELIYPGTDKGSGVFFTPAVVAPSRKRYLAHHLT